MALIDRLRSFWEGRKSLTEVPAGFRWPESRTGYQVSALSSLEVSTVMACVRAITEGTAQVPIYAHERNERGERGRKVSSPVIDRLRKPNAWQTEFEFRETIALHAVLVGNAFVYVSRRGNPQTGDILELIPIEPGKVFVTRERDMTLTYRVTFEDGSAPILLPGQIWHIRGPSWNSWMGLDAVKYARESIGLAVATEARHAALHKSGAQVGGVLSVEGTLSEAQFKQLSTWLDRHAVGGDRQGKPIIADRNTKWSDTTMTGVDAQHLETRRHQVLEICRHFRVQPMIIGATETPTFNSAEQLRIMHVTDTLTPWAERIEQSLWAALSNDPGVEFRHDFRGMMRGANAERAEYYAKSLGSGGSPAWNTPNEIRAMEGDDPIEGGNELPRPMNAQTAPVIESTTNEA